MNALANATDAADVEELCRRAVPIVEQVAEKFYREHTRLGAMQIDDLASAGTDRVREHLDAYDRALPFEPWAKKLAFRGMYDAHKSVRASHARTLKRGIELPTVSSDEDLIDVAERLRARAEAIDEGSRPSRRTGFGDAGRMAIALLIQHTGCTAEAMSIKLSTSPALIAALKLPHVPKQRTVAYCASVAQLAIKINKLLS